jgi:hypothetical protein
MVFKSIKVSFSPEKVPYKAFSPKKDLWALFTGTSGPNQKGIFILEDASGQRFIKVALGEFASDVLQNEALALTFLNQTKHSSFSIPQVLLSGNDLVQITGLETGRTERCLSQNHQAALLELVEINKENLTPNEIPAWTEAFVKIEALAKNYDERPPKGLIRKLQSLSKNLNWNQQVKVCFSNGDFTLWNLFVNQSTLGIYNWELSENQRPIGFDAFHFLTQNGILVEHKPCLEIREDLKTQTQFLLTADSLEQYPGFYLVMNPAYFLDLYSHQEKLKPQIEWVLKTRS